MNKILINSSKNGKVLTKILLLPNNKISSLLSGGRLKYKKLYLNSGMFSNNWNI